MLATITDLRRIVRSVGGRVTFGDGTADLMTVANAEQFLLDALNEMKSEFGEKIEELSSDSFIYSKAVRLQCFIFMRMVMGVFASDLTRLEMVEREIAILKNGFRKRKPAISVAGGYFEYGDL